jgi:hypothetical protein
MSKMATLKKYMYVDKILADLCYADRLSNVPSDGEVDISDQESAGRQRRMCIFYVVYA